MRRTLGRYSGGRAKVPAEASADDRSGTGDAMGVRYWDVADNLRAAYDAVAAERDSRAKSPWNWKVAERDLFLQRLREYDCRQLLEIGAGTGQDSLFFQSSGLEVIATDLSPTMVTYCSQKGIDSQVMDLMHPRFPPKHFDAVYAMNCLLHIPNTDLPSALEGIQAVIRHGGLFFLGVYGGHSEEGVAEDDDHSPPRFFSRRTDEEIEDFTRRYFDVVDFHVVDEGAMHFQSLTLRRPPERYRDPQ
jgi:SAM-dependent methyltransferase